MKSAAEVAKDLDLHPANLILYMCSLGAALEHVWPKCDRDWISTLKSAHWERFGEKVKESTQGVELSQPHADGSLSETARRILAKMAAKRHYGTNVVSFDTVKKHYAVAADDAEEAIDELVRLGLLQSEDRRGPYRLNHGRAGEIERLTGGRP